MHKTRMSSSGFDVSEVLPHEFVEAFVQYFENSENVTAQLRDICLAVDPRHHYSIHLDVLDLLDRNSLLGGILLSKPLMAISHCESAIQESLRRILTLDDERAMMILKEHINPHFEHLPLCSEVTKKTISEVRNSDIHRLVSVLGTVIRTGAVKMLEYEREYECSKCKELFRVKVNMEQRNSITKPSQCPRCSHPRVRQCNAEDVASLCRDYQEIKVQDHVTHLSVGGIPRSIVLVLHDELVDACKAGDDIVASGIVMRRWKPLVVDGRCDVEMFILCTGITVISEQRSCVSVTEEQVVEYEEFWYNYRTVRKKPIEGRNLFVSSMCPQIYGMAPVKLAMALSLIGGVQLESTGLKVRGESHMLMIGDPGCGKSQFLKYAAKLSSRAVLTTGIGTTSAGLTVLAAKDTSGDWCLEAGALVLADHGICCIDEFDSIREHDRAAIHEAMEQQTISVAKAGLVCKLHSRTTVLAATNPKLSKMDVNTSVMVNCALNTPLLSRFDVVMVLLDKQKEQRDRSVSSFILKSQRTRETREDNEQFGSWSSLSKIQGYMSYVKHHYNPSLNSYAQRILSMYYQLRRSRIARDAGRTTIRLLESLVRLSQAHARLMYRDEVTLSDAVAVVYLLELCSESFSLGDEFDSLGIVAGDAQELLYSEFSRDPDNEFAGIRDRVLRILGFDELRDLEDGSDPSHPMHEVSTIPSSTPQSSNRTRSDLNPDRWQGADRDSAAGAFFTQVEKSVSERRAQVRMQEEHGRSYGSGLSTSSPRIGLSEKSSSRWAKYVGNTDPLDYEMSLSGSSPQKTETAHVNRHGGRKEFL